MPGKRNHLKERRIRAEIERAVGQRAASAREHRRSRHLGESAGALGMVRMIVREQDGGDLASVLETRIAYGTQMGCRIGAGINHDALRGSGRGQHPGVRSEEGERRRVVGKDHASMGRHASASPGMQARHGSRHESTASPPSRTTGLSITLGA